MLAQCQEPAYPAQLSSLSCFYDEPVWNFKEQGLVQENYPIFKTSFSELEEVISRFQTSSSSGLNVNHVVHPLDERKQRRKASNRESARRSRWRKKTHFENLTAELNRLKVQKRELKNRFSSTLNMNHTVRRENDRLKAESLVLWARFSSLSQILLARRLLMNSVTSLMT